MTGIEQLRKMGADAVRGGDIGRAICDIADQIERERECDADTIENVRLIVGGVVDEMERHILGHEGMEDSPVARWARELHEALDGDGRDPANDVSMSAYDLLPQEDRDAIAWVREHGGLDSVKKLLDWVVGHCSTKQQLDFDFWLSGRVMHELGFDDDMADRGEVERRLLARLMPEGMEWLVEAWPRFEDDAPVRFLDDFERYGEESGVSVVTMYLDGSFALNFLAYSKGERVNRPVADTWERLEEDCAKSDVDYCAERGLLDPSCDTVEGDASTRHCTDCGCTCGEKMARDLVRRAKKLAGVSE